MEADAELRRIPLVSTRFSLSMAMCRLTRDGTAETVSRDQIIRRERGQGNIHFPCSADHEQFWQPYPVDPYSCYMCDYTYIHTYDSLRCPSWVVVTSKITSAEARVDSRQNQVFNFSFHSRKREMGRRFATADIIATLQ